jgi:prolyl-tRNA synthetase
MEGLPERITALLDEVQQSLIDRARQFREEHTVRVDSYAAFKEVMEGRPGFVIAPWCGSAACEAQIKTDTQATIRNMPLITSHAHGIAATSRSVPGTCIRCDAPATSEAWFAKAY